MRILVYDDNLDFGGHQVMACRGTEALVAHPPNEVLFMFNPRNRKLAEQLPSVGKIQILKTPCSTRKLQGWRNRLDKSGIRTLKKQFRRLQIDLVLCIQGDIEDSSQAVLAARQAGIECISYLAIPHTMKLMGAKLGAFRDRTNHYLFNQPSRYIVISESMKQLLKNRGADVPIDVVQNGIAPPSPRPTPNPDLKTLGMLGRIEFNQKRQDFMLETFCTHADKFENCNLLIAGDGPDRKALARQIKGSPRRDDIILLPWQQDTASFYDRIDCLLLPSRYEGVPLAMLEALARGIPVIGSRRDGIKDILPEKWTFEPGNGHELAKTFSAIRGNWYDDIALMQQRIRSEMSIETFKTAFLRAVMGDQSRT